MDLIFHKILRQIETHKPHVVWFRQPRNAFCVFARRLADSKPFRAFSTICIAVNAGFMLSDHADASADFEHLMDLQNHAFFYEIVMENAVSFAGHGPLIFIYDSWKCFDLLVMLGSAASYLSPESKLSAGVQVIDTVS